MILNDNSGIIKLSKEGQFIWRKEVEQKIFGYNLRYCKEISNGNIQILGGKFKPFFLDDAQTWVCVINFDASGKIKSEKLIINTFDLFEFNCVNDINNCTICASAIQYRDTSSARGYLFKISSRGDSIWSREFTHGWKDRDEVFRNITYASDGGYYLTGYNWVQGDNSSKAWVVKVDSNGCVVAGCNTAVNVEKEVYGSLFQLFPNPAVDYLSIYLNDEDLQYRSYILKCYNQNGKQVLTREISGRKSDIDLGNLTSGMHFYQISDGSKLIQNGKLVKM
ncbi:MAG: T9SS type A sorting domain-containing protein [Saprospiraceae bacterium]|nr:T9SS type A sorting domain-containing protein [Saprospiraceae bacterium]HMW40288.1 T9SS type A sorting domain-containing protein [Saprospiraceae bacterium]HMZ40282.1 T9SS type A sorting domain-containing protein [Saprospiraceae bacterium]HNA65140.1 T9SS type A sorting domain-containing protein [Saprospiraceae bacterium]HNC35965.1 T9SS type A sorting domain-containing protein [Saprospiraceae bacterium]